jgi:hypothetical protein
VLVQGEEPPAWTKLPPTFAPRALHLLRLEVNGRFCRLWLDHATWRWEGDVSALVEQVRIEVEEGSLALDALELTRGFEEDFCQAADLAGRGWQLQPADCIQVQDGALRLRPDAGQSAVFSRSESYADGELVLNLALQHGASCAVQLSGQAGSLLVSESGLAWQSNGQRQVLDAAPILAGEFVHLRLRKQGGALLVAREERFFAPFTVPDQQVHFQIEVSAPGADFDLIRLSEIPRDDAGKA